MRSPLAILREIQRNSRRVERNRFDRVQGAGFVLFAFLAPFLVWKMQSWHATESSEVLMIVRVYEALDGQGRGGKMVATEIKASERSSSWKAMQVIGRTGKFVGTDQTRSHVAAWVFSSGAWWIMLSFALAVLLAPMRLGWWLYRRTRTVVRQSRIDRCHCPNCGYNAKHSILRGRCPECGSELYERPDVY